MTVATVLSLTVLAIDVTAIEDVPSITAVVIVAAVARACVLVIVTL